MVGEAELDAPAIDTSSNCSSASSLQHVWVFARRLSRCFRVCSLCPSFLTVKGVLNAKKKLVPETGIFKRARGQYMPSPRCSQLFNPESLAPNLYKHTTI